MHKSHTIDQEKFDREVLRGRTGSVRELDLALPYLAVVPRTFPDRAFASMGQAQAYCEGLLQAATETDTTYVVELRPLHPNAYLVSQSTTAFIDNVSDLLPKIFADGVVERHQRQKVEADAQYSREQDNSNKFALLAVVGAAVGLLIYFVFSR